MAPAQVFIEDRNANTLRFARIFGRWTWEAVILSHVLLAENSEEGISVSEGHRLEDVRHAHSVDVYLENIGDANKHLK